MQKATLSSLWKFGTNSLKLATGAMAMLTCSAVAFAQQPVPESRRRRSKFEVARPVVSNVPERIDGPQVAPFRHPVLHLRPSVRPGDLFAPEKSAGAPVHARNFGPDLRNLQNLSHYAGQVPDAARGRSSPWWIVLYFGMLLHYEAFRVIII